MSRFALYLHRLHVEAPTGIHRYARELAGALVAAAPADETITLWTGREARVPADAPAWERQLAWPRRPLHGAWTLAGRPLLERLTGPTDLAHLLSPAFPLPTRAPLVVTVHDLLPVTDPQWYSSRARWAFGRAVRASVRHAAAVITPTELVRAQVLELLGVDPARVHVVAQGVHLPPVAPAGSRTPRPPGRGHLLAVGEIGPRKNFGVVFSALENWPEGPELVVVGADGPQAAGTHAAAAPLGDRVRFTGRLDDAAVAALMDGASGLVAPASFEGFGMVPIEAMARGVPVVVSDSVAEVVGDAGLYAAADDPRAWLRQLRALYEPGRADQLRAAGYRRAAAFSWEACARRTRAVYDAALAGRAEA